MFVVIGLNIILYDDDFFETICDVAERCGFLLDFFLSGH